MPAKVDRRTTLPCERAPRRGHVNKVHAPRNNNYFAPLEYVNERTVGDGKRRGIESGWVIEVHLRKSRIDVMDHTKSCHFRKCEKNACMHSCMHARF